jgi:hypothetical protein
MSVLSVGPGDVLDDSQFELAAGAPDAAADQFGLEAVDERFGGKPPISRISQVCGSHN